MRGPAVRLRACMAPVLAALAATTAAQRAGAQSIRVPAALYRVAEASPARADTIAHLTVAGPPNPQVWYPWDAWAAGADGRVLVVRNRSGLASKPITGLLRPQSPAFRFSPPEGEAGPNGPASPFFANPESVRWSPARPRLSRSAL